MYNKEKIMKLALFGTGRFYQDYKAHLSKCDIEFILDNDLKKQGQMMDGRIISAPDKVDYLKCDYVIIMVKKTEEIRKQ